MHKLTKFYLLLLLAVIIAGSALTYQLIRARKITVKPVETPLISEGYYDITIEDDDPILGNPGAPLTVVLFSNYSCTNCQSKYRDITAFVKAHPQDVRLYIKNTPQGGMIFKANDLAERAVFCANKQNKFWQFSDAVIENKQTVNENNLSQIANDLKLNTTDWLGCLNSDTAIQKTKRAIDLAASLGIDQFPTIYVNNKKINLDKDLSITDMLTKFIVK
ncbi:MAG: DsbA oxidoreductase [uncultured bacterium]|nr:MAG: DsbA oxidoreductase [uncultured bacterium]